MLTVIERDGFDGAANLAYEEALFADARAWPRPLLLFYVNDPCVVLGRANPEGEWVDRAACERDGVPVLRRFSGGGTVYHDRDNLNYSFIVPRTVLDHCLRGAGRGPAKSPEGKSVNSTQSHPEDEQTLSGPAARSPKTIDVHSYISFFRQLIIRALSSASTEFTETSLSDISLKGHKVSGNAQRIASNIVLHHGTLMLRCPLEAIERYLPVPPNRVGVPHRGFVGGLQELGLDCGMEEIKAMIAAEFRRSL